MSGSYSAITNGIEVSVEPFYLDDESRPEESEYIWAYMVEIHNGGSEPVQLMTRYWQITDGLGRLEEVRGEGLMLGVRFKESTPVMDIVNGAYAQHMLTLPAAENTLRLLPPLNATDEELSECVSRIDAVCNAVKANAA